MNRRYLLRTILILGIVIASVMLWFRPHPIPSVVEAPQTRPETQVVPETPEKPIKRGDETIGPAPLKKGTRPFYGSLPQGVRSIRELPMANKPSTVWRKKLENHIKKLGGPTLKSYSVTPEESYVVPDGQEGRYVERVVVTITGKKGEYTSFFAEVDSETGYVIKSWGAAIPEKRGHRH
jgi:hypothetical protein